MYIKLDTIIKEYEKLSTLAQNNILWSALSIMESYNGNSQWHCVAMAMGYSNEIGSQDTWIKKS